MRNSIDHTGNRFGALTVRSLVGVARGHRWWDCYCECGKSTFVKTGDLTSGNTQSCGCGQRAAAARACVERGTHFLSRTRLYTIWRGMLARCYNKRATNYTHYGKLGVIVCRSWHRFDRFAAWALDNGYTAALTLDRKDPRGDYRPGNCRWATWSVQQRNKRARYA